MIRAHVLRNALLPVITFAGIQLGQMAGGAVLTETVFAWPGIGRLMFDALLQRDYQLLLGIFLVTSIMVVVFNLLTDVLYRLIDPRIGAGAQQSRRMKSFARRYMRNHGAVAGLVIVLLVVAVALAAPLLYEESPWMMVADPLIPPFTNADYPFGTDMLGRDITAGLVWGARVSLLVGLLSTAVALGFGIVVGAIAGYCGGRIDDALMRFTEFFQTIPQLAMAVVLVAIIGPSVYSIMGAIALVSWPPAARLVRSEFMTLKQREFVQAAIVIGQAPARIVGTQILPNAMSPIIVSASFMVATAILTESSLSFLGLGDRNEMSWGFMIGAARTMIREAWWMSVWPGVAILLTVLAINLIGEGLNDALNPQLRKRGE